MRNEASGNARTTAQGLFRALQLHKPQEHVGVGLARTALVASRSTTAASSQIMRSPLASGVALKADVAELECRRVFRPPSHSH